MACYQMTLAIFVIVSIISISKLGLSLVYSFQNLDAVVVGKKGRKGIRSVNSLIIPTASLLVALSRRASYTGRTPENKAG